MSGAKRILIRNGPTDDGNGNIVAPALAFAEPAVSVDQNIVMIGTGTTNPHIIQTTHSTAVIDYSQTPGIIQRIFQALGLSTPSAPAYQTNTNSARPSGICEPSDGDVGIVVEGVLIGRFTSTGLVLTGGLSYTGGSGSTVLSHGTTAQRPATPVQGFIWENTTLGAIEWYDGTTWHTVAGGGGSTLSPWAKVTTGRAVAAGERLIANTDGGAFTLTLSATPTDLDEIWFMGDFLTHNLTINPNGKQIARSSNNFVMNEDDIGMILVYDNTIGSWRIKP